MQKIVRQTQRKTIWKKTGESSYKACVTGASIQFVSEKAQKFTHRENSCPSLLESIYYFKYDIIYIIIIYLSTE